MSFEKGKAYLDDRGRKWKIVRIMNDNALVRRTWRRRCYPGVIEGRMIMFPTDRWFPTDRLDWIFIIDWEDGQ